MNETPPASKPAMGAMDEASAMEMDGLNMNPMSSSTPLVGEHRAQIGRSVAQTTRADEVRSNVRA